MMTKHGEQWEGLQRKVVGMKAMGQVREWPLNCASQIFAD